MKRIIIAALLALAPSCAFSAQQPINVGATPNDGTGDSLRTAFGKVNANTSELYTLVGAKQPLSAILTGLSALSPAADQVIYATGTGTFATASLPAFARGLISSPDAGTARTALGLGGAAVLNVGTSAGSVAAGNDSRIVGATQNAAAAITGGTINGAAIGGITPAPGAFTTVSAATPISASSGGTGYGSVSTALDGLFSSTQGAVLYRGATGWQGLGPGTAGQVLTTNGAGANPSWAVPGGAIVIPVGQVRLTYNSASALLVRPINGNQIVVNGAYQTVPSAGVTCPNTGLSAATLYYAYLYVSGSTLACEVVTTTHATSTSNGVEIKSGDATRTLVGMAYTDAGTPGTFADSSTKRWVATWFNRRGVQLSGSVSGATSGSTSAVTLSGSTVQFLSWADEAITVGAIGSAQNTAANSLVYSSVMIDGSTVGNAQIGQAFANSSVSPLGLAYTATLTEGLHNTSVAGYVNSGSGMWSLTNTVSLRQ